MYSKKLCFLFLLLLLNNNCSTFNKKNISVLYQKPSAKLCLFKKIWQVSVNKGIDDFYSNLTLAVRNNIVFVANRQGMIKAINAINGQIIWINNLTFNKSPALLSGGINVYNKTLYIGSEKANLYALDINNGSIIWTNRVSGEILSSPIVSNGLVIVHSSDGMLQAFDKDSGIFKWIIRLYDPPFLSIRGLSTPSIVSDNIVIIGSDTGIINAVNINKGNIIWQKFISFPRGTTDIKKLNDIDHAPVFLEKKIYTFSYDGFLSILDVDSGKIIWNSKKISNFITNLLVDENYIYLISSNKIRAISKDNKSIVWNQNIFSDFSILEHAVLYNKYIILSDKKGYFYWIDKNNGNLIYRQKLDNYRIQSFMMLDQNKLLIYNKKGDVYLLRINLC